MVGEDDFQVAPTKSNNKNSKRVYIGNLPISFEDQHDLQSSLEKWIQDRIPKLSIVSLQVNAAGRGKYPHALLDCGAQANEVIRSLHQQTFHGQRLNVQREKRNNANKINHDGPKKKAFGGKNWAEPTLSRNDPHQQDAAKTTTFSRIPVDQAASGIQSAVEDEFKHAEDAEEDPLNVALASTAAASLLAAMNAFDGNDDEPEEFRNNFAVENDLNPTNWDHKTTSVMFDNNNFDFEDEEEREEPATFQMKSIAELLADFGSADPDWKNKRIDTSAQDSNEAEKEAPINQLAPKGKAPIHVCLTSFGFSKGAPKRMDGWSFRQPLLPLDCRDYPTVPIYLAWQDGLSGAVKRALQYPQDQTRGRLGDGGDEEGNPKNLHQFARHEVAPQIWQAVVDAQNEGGHGYLSPLEMTIYVGSDSGRHRSVVVCEWAATQLRKMLRANKNDVIQQPVSVGTFHRDVDHHRQQQYNLKSGGNGKNNADEAKGKTLKKKQLGMAGDW